MKSSILKVNNLSKTYYSKEGSVKALQDISFDLTKGEILSIVGPSGSGKSTILNIIGNSDKDYLGTITMNKNLTIGYVTQEDDLISNMTCFNNAILFLKVLNKVNKETINYVDYLLSIYGLSDFKNKKVSSLSGGMKKRLSIIRALSIKPDILLIDEAFSSLDFVSRLNIYESIYKIIKEENITTILVTHDIEEAISLSDKIIVLSKRPSSIKKVYNISFTLSKSILDRRNFSNFSLYFKDIWENIDNYE